MDSFNRCDDFCLGVRESLQFWSSPPSWPADLCLDSKDADDDSDFLNSSSDSDDEYQSDLGQAEQLAKVEKASDDVSQNGFEEGVYFFLSKTCSNDFDEELWSNNPALCS